MLTNLFFLIYLLKQKLPMRSYTLIMTICIALMLFLDADCQYMTNPDRTDSVNSLCSSF